MKAVRPLLPAFLTLPGRRAWLVAASLVCAVVLLLPGCRRDDGVSVRFFDEEPFPKKLSEWRLFIGTPADLVSNHGVLPYDLNTSLFTDYALKHRTIWMPKERAAAYQEASVLDLPRGTILSKTFYYMRRDLRGAHAKPVATAGSGPDPAGKQSGLTRERAPGTAAERFLIETRLLIHTSDGWKALPYVWNPEQTEAELRIAGDRLEVELKRPSRRNAKFDYIVPNMDQCAGCHVRQIKFDKQLKPIGPEVANLNRDYDYAAGRSNQLQRLATAGYLTGLPQKVAPRMVDWTDSDAALEARARAYLHVQCAHCHSEQGPASTSGLMLTASEAEPGRLGRCKPPIAAGRGSGGLLYSIVPGKPERSILLYRMDSTEPDVMMPELGRSLIHEEAVTLIKSWIARMPGSCT